MLNRLISVVLIVSLILCGCSMQESDSYTEPASEVGDSVSCEETMQVERDNVSIGGDNDQGNTVDQWTPKYVNVKYRDTPVDIAAPYFEYLDTTGSSFIRGAWYDQDNQYMVINLDGVYYHYCGLPFSVWNSFKKADSFGRFYNQSIKGLYDCRQGYVPGY